MSRESKCTDFADRELQVQGLRPWCWVMEMFPQALCKISSWSSLRKIIRRSRSRATNVVDSGWEVTHTSKVSHMEMVHRKACK